MNPLKFILLFVLIAFMNCSESDAAEKSRQSSIIYLQGTCSAGKTTLIQSLLNQWDHLVVVDEDSIMHRSYVSAVAARFPKEFGCIQQAIAEQNLYHALREKDVLFKRTASDEEREKAANALCAIQDELNRAENLAWKQAVSRGIDAEVLRQIREGVEQKQDIILDSWYIKPSHLQVYFPDTQVIRVLLYCPLPLAYERFLKRNHEALCQENLLEKRYLRQLVGSFFLLYQIDPHPLQPIQAVKKQEFDHLLERISQTLKEGNPLYQKPIFTFEEVSRAYFLTIKDEFLKPFDESGEVFYICPKETQDLMIDNSSSRVEDVVCSIKALIDQKTAESR